MSTGTPAFLSAEYDSRMKTTLNAAGGNYDQVVAVSQYMINLGLASIYEKNKEVMNTFDGSNAFGSISGDLGPSQIKIPVNLSDAFTVVWIWNFTGGTFTYKPPEGGSKKMDLEGWSVAVMVPLVASDYEDKPGDSDDTKEYKRKSRQWFTDNFNVPGDYRPERLYAKMADAHWGSIAFERGTFKVGGKVLSYDDWKRIPGNDDAADNFEMLMKKICRQRAEQGLTTAGFSFKFQPTINEKPATYPPKQLQHQSYPYKLPASSGMTDPNWINGVESLSSDPGSRNCLLYCELVDDRPFAGAQIPYTGNFTTFGGTEGTPKSINGTFALSHQLFYERFLLPKLQVFVQQSQIYPEKANFRNEGRTISVTLGYIVGANPDKDKNNNASIDIYKFKAVAAQDGKPAYYQAHVDVTQELDPFASPERGEWTKFFAEGSPTVTVSWAKGSNRITVRGETHYRSHGTTANNNIVDPTLHQIVPASSWWHGHYEMTWELHIDCAPENGGLTMKISHDPNFVNVIAYPDNSKEWHWTDPNTPERIRSTIQSSMNRQLEWLQSTLNSGFADQLKFTYPGNGQLKFGDAVFNENGDLLAVIDYGDLPTGKIDITRPATLTDPPSTGGSKIECPGGNTKPPKPTGPRLTWTTNSPLKASKKPAAAGEDTRVTLQITGKNDTKDTVYLSTFDTDIDGHSNPKEALFNVLAFTTTPAQANTTNVLVGVEVNPAPPSPVVPKLTVSRNSSRSYTCHVAVSANDGPIVVPAGGAITMTFKGVTGNPGAPGTLSVREVWSDDKGVVSTGDDAGIRAALNVTLTD